MQYSEDHIALAAEYALGTLAADERAQVEAMMEVDQEFAAVVRAWEYRLGVLNQMVGSVEPSPALWEKIRTAIGSKNTSLVQQPTVSSAPPDVQPATFTVPEPPPVVEDIPAPPPVTTPQSQISEAVEAVQLSLAEPLFAPPPAPPVASAPPVAPVPPIYTPSPRPANDIVADRSNVVPMPGRERAYRNLAVAMTAIAAVLLAIIGVQVVAPGALPGLGGKPSTRVADVKPAPSPAPATAPQYVALLQGSAGGPAFIMTVDGGTKTFTVRKAGAPPIDVNQNYELWLISDKAQSKPRSLGVVGMTDFVARPTLASYDSDTVNNATYAVTIEQSGGSPDGIPHSQPVYAGRLIETVPAASLPAPAQNR